MLGIPVVTDSHSSSATFDTQHERSTGVCTYISAATTLRAMKKRRELTADELADAERLRAAFKRKQEEAKDQGKRLTQEDVAIACGWSGQSAFGQYYRGVIPLNVEAVLAISKALGISAEDISPSIYSSLEEVVDRRLMQAYAMLDYEDDAPEKHLNVEERTNVAPALQPHRPPQTYPLISWVAAGERAESPDLYVPGDGEEMLESTENAGPHGYWLKVKGKSMTSDTPPSFPEGTPILVRPEGFDLISGKFYLFKHKDGEKTFKQYNQDAGREYMTPLNNKDFRQVELDSEWQVIGRVIDAKITGL